MAAKHKLPTKFTAPVTWIGEASFLEDDADGFYGMAFVEQDADFFTAPAVFQYKNGVYDAVDGATDRMWIVTFKTTPDLSSLIKNLLYATNFYACVCGLPESLASLGVISDGDLYLYVRIAYKRIGKKTCVFKGRGEPRPNDNMPLWADVKTF